MAPVLKADLMRKKKFDNSPKLTDLEKALQDNDRVSNMYYTDGFYLCFTFDQTDYRAMTTKKRVAIFQGSHLVFVDNTVPAIVRQLLFSASDTVNGSEFTAGYTDEFAG